MESPSEYAECKALFQWAEMNPITRGKLIHHVNEGKRSGIMGKMLLAIGMRKGLPDYQLLIPNKTYHCLWLEMKRRDHEDKPKRPSQMYWQTHLLELKHYATFVYGWEDAVSVITDYLNDRITY